MSELIVTPGFGQSPEGGLQPDYGLQVISEQPVLLQRPPTTLEGTVSAFGSTANDFIAAINPDDPTVFNISGEDGADTLVGAAGPDVISGGAGDDAVSGGVGDDALSGGLGNDLLQGEVGHDYLRGDEGNDTLIGGEGIDLLMGGPGNDVLDGGPGRDVLIGGPGRDALIGGPGNDALQGGPGRDTLTGGSGRDKFRFERGSTGGSRRRDADIITDFDPRQDTIQLDRRLLKGSGLRRGKLQAEDFAVVREFSSDVDAKIVYESSTGLVYFNTKQGSSSVLLQLDRNLNNIASSDFEIFY